MIKIILIGPPGSGKGTISYKLNKNYNLIHISTGDLFRKTAKQKTPLAEDLRMIMGSGQLVPDELTNEIAKNEIISIVNQNKGFILDGYPRTIEQAIFLNGVIDIDKVFYLNIDKEVLIKRIIGRRTCSKCGKIYNIYFSKPKNGELCDKCNIPLSQRKDDNVETVNNRLEIYDKATAPLINFYREKNKLIEIDASLSIREVMTNIEEEI